MPTIDLSLHDGKTATLEMPDAGTGKSCFIVGLPKAGSTLFNNIMRPMTNRAGLSFFSLPNALNAMGLPVREITGGLQSVFQPVGYTYGGFRGFDAEVSLPPFASGRTVFLVRDPRDMVTSLYFSEAYSHRPPGNTESDALEKAFNARREAALSEAIDDFVLRRASGILASFENTQAKLEGIDHRSYRYEDIIFSKQEWIADVVKYLGLDVRPKQREKIVSRFDVQPDAEDVTRHIRRVAPGDHKDKLTPETIAKLNEIFAPIFARHKYS